MILVLKMKGLTMLTCHHEMLQVAAQRQNESYSGSSKKKIKPEDLVYTVSKEVELDVDTVDNAKEIEEAINFNEADLAIAN